MKEEIELEDPLVEVEPLTDYETERDKPMPNRIHGIIEARTAIFLGLHYGHKFDVATEVSLETPFKPSTPDVVLMEKRPLDFFDDTPREVIPPLLAVEIVSPSQGFSVFKEKAERYFAFGVRSYWVVEPHYREVRVFSSPRQFATFKQDELLRDPQLGIEMPLSEIFS